MNDKEYRAEQIAAVAREIARLDLVNVVRCKDCRKRNNIHGQDWCRESAKYITPKDFCSWGERREQEPVEVWNQWSADDVTCSEES